MVKYEKKVKEFKLKGHLTALSILSIVWCVKKGRRWNKIKKNILNRGQKQVGCM